MAVYAVADGADVPVGEATVPIADPKAETMTGWWHGGKKMQEADPTALRGACMSQGSRSRINRPESTKRPLNCAK